MVNGIRTIHPNELNKGFSSKFRVGSLARQESPKECWKMHWPKCCEYKDEDSSPITLNDKNLER